jgi:hypothetical protein
MTMALSSKLLLSILQTEYETPAVGEWVTSRQADVKDGIEERYTTSGGARSTVVAYWQLKAVLRIVRLQGAALVGLQSPLELARHNLRRRVSILRREGRFGLSSAEMTASSTG